MIVYFPSAFYFHFLQNFFFYQNANEIIYTLKLLNRFGSYSEACIKYMNTYNMTINA